MIKDETLKNSHILIVDDREANVMLLERLLQTAGYTNFLSTNDPRQVLPMFGKFQPDLILLASSDPAGSNRQVPARFDPAGSDDASPGRLRRDAADWPARAGRGIPA